MMQHVTMYVKDLEASIAFYEKYIGLKVQGDLRPFGMPIIFMAENADETKLEMIQDPEKAFNGSGISIGFHTEDVEAAREAFLKEGLTCTPMISPKPDVKFFFVTDPNGLQIQLI